MEGHSPFSKTTLVVLLGASEWPNWPDLNLEIEEKGMEGGASFAASAEAVKAYFKSEDGFNLLDGNLLDLFNSKDPLSDQLQKMLAFLKDRAAALNEAAAPATHLVIYYIGHGGYFGNEYLLVLRDSQQNNKKGSSLNPESIVEITRDNARKFRLLFIIDSCFAEAAENAFKESPFNGVSLLCSSGRNNSSRAIGDEHFTMFSGALLQVLQHGDKEGPVRFTLRGLGQSIKKEIRRKYGEDGVDPVVTSPVQRGDDLADTQFFPNPGRRLLKNSKWQVVENELARCFVVESATEMKVARNQPLSFMVGSALVKYRGVLSAKIGKQMDTAPVAVNADRVVATVEGFKNAIQALCQADIAVFDVTNYEPVVMLLMGIRSVVRQGVTIASAGGNYIIGEAINYPFNIKEVNIISHSKEQAEIYHPIDLIGDKLIAGFEQLRHLPDYLDLPAFHAIRSLPPDREQRIPKEHNEQVLLLCPFSRSYSGNNWKTYLKPYLAVYLPQNAQSNSPPILRTLDMKSPRLVSQSLYEAMRLTQMCIVDWTQWRPNVFFEMGVRLAAVDIDPVCIIEDRSRRLIRELADIQSWEQQIEKIRLFLDADKAADKHHPQEDFDPNEVERYAHISYQGRRLLELFDLIEYRAPRNEPIGEKDREAYEKMVRSHEQLIKTNQRADRQSEIPPGFTYWTISDHIDTSMEMSAFPVHDELIRAADLLSDPQINTTGRPSVLYPKNESLTGKANLGALERRLAAWYYIENRLEEELKSDPALQMKFKNLGNLIARALIRSPRKGDKELGKRIRQRVEELPG